MKYDIKNIKLAPEGKLKIEWAESEMPVLRLIRGEFLKKKPLKGVRISACLHVTSETANLMRTLKAGGALVSLCAANPLSTQDEVAASLVKDHKIPVFAKSGEDKKTYYQHLMAVLDLHPKITMDDGGDLVNMLHSKRKNQAGEIWGSSEETTTGVLRLKNMEQKGILKFLAIAVNSSKTKFLFDNRYGTGQSTIDSILRATNILLAGKMVVVCGYGWCGRGVAMRARGMGSRVIICEIDPLKALEALMDGFEVLPLVEASRIGDIFITVTGDKAVIRREHFQKMKDGVIVCNTGHFNVEIDLVGLKKLSKARRQVRPFVEEYTLKNNKKINILAQGRIVNLVAAEGHPAQVMDMSFANQALAAEYIVKNHQKLEKKVYPLPSKIDQKIAELKLKSLGVKIDKLTKEQKEYLESWQMGT